MNVYFYRTALGRIGIAENSGKITNLLFENEAMPDGALETQTPVLAEAARQLIAYLSGSLRAFSLPIEPAGTVFQRAVWAKLREIPYGLTASYKEIAAAVDNPKAVRAVGMANNRNPIPIFIPCHRVIGSDGSLVGYGGGLDIKRKLLDLEKGSGTQPGK